MDCHSFCKSFVSLLACCSILFVAACTVNPATGEQRFDGLMSREEEQKLGDAQHQQIAKEYGGVYNNPGLQAYVNEIGRRVAANSERKDVTFRFTVLDSPVVNAFALPGGYIYTTRGTLALANDEDEIAAVLAHEIGHVTARHQAARYSQGVLTSLGVGIVGAVLGNAAITQALDLGNSLYMTSYSREQEAEADALGVRYLVRAGYDQFAMSRFLNHLGLYEETKLNMTGKEDASGSLFSDHPATLERVAATSADAAKYPERVVNPKNADTYLSKIRGLVYGDNAEQGFVRNGVFYHPDLGFAFRVPEGFELANKSAQLIAKGKDGSVLILDMAESRVGADPENYLIQDWLDGERLPVKTERIEINGFQAATLAANATIDNAPSNLRLIAIGWKGRDMVRFQIVIPSRASAQTVENLKRSTYSFRRMSDAERQNVKPVRIALVTAKTGDTVQKLAGQMQLDRMKVEWFRTLNGLGANEQVVSGRRYKVVE